jgi:hypothetical protein
VKEDLEKGTLQLMRMKDISPQTEKKIKTKLLAGYGIELSPTTSAPKTSRKFLDDTLCASLFQLGQ